MEHKDHIGAVDRLVRGRTPMTVMTTGTVTSPSLRLRTILAESSVFARAAGNEE